MLPTNQVERLISLTYRWRRNYPEVKFVVIDEDRFILVRLTAPETTMRGQIAFLRRELHIIGDNALYLKLAIQLSEVFNEMRERLKDRGYYV